MQGPTEMIRDLTDKWWVWVVDELLRVLRRGDLVVIASPGRDRLERALFGSGSSSPGVLTWSRAGSSTIVRFWGFALAESQDRPKSTKSDDVGSSCPAVRCGGGATLGLL